MTRWNQELSTKNQVQTKTKNQRPKTELRTMSLLDILHLALRNLRQAKLRAVLTTMGVIVGVAVIVTMVSFGLGLQRNMLARFKALDLFNEMSVFGKSLTTIAAGMDRSAGR